ncbi:MAG: glutaredoxin [Bradyrhizobium sp.]|jgi:glutaredoxin
MKHLQAILTGTLVVASMLASGGGIAQQMYKWTGADGKLNYTDTPPPASARSSESTDIPGAANDSSSVLPYVLVRAAQNHPVVLYTTKTCVPCDLGRAYLAKRGIPYTEKTVNSAADIEHLKRSGGDGTMPMLLVGRSKQTGFESGAWGNMLTAAAYPETSRLPSGYRNPPAGAAAPVTDKVQAEPVEPPGMPAPRSLTSPIPTGKTDSGFRF